MKYKAKFAANQKHFHTSYTCKIQEGEVFEDKPGLTPGVFVFIPFTDTNFFEPVNTRKFEIEVNEDQMHNFHAYVLQHDDRWIVTEITEPLLPYWVIEFKSQNPEATIESYEGIDPVWFKKNFIDRKLEGLKWIRNHTDCGLISAKWLAEYIFNTF